MHFADIQKVTLQVHVRVLDPDEWLRPEMLCQVGFRGDAGVSLATTAADVVLVPARLVDAGFAWVVTAEGKATRRPVKTGARMGDHVEVVDGLNLADKVIDGGRERISEGVCVRTQER